jgi:ABC-type sugar transport system permease subunit
MPSLIFMAAFTVWPVFRSIWLSLTKYKLGMSAPEFIGLKNYINLAGSSLFWKVMGNTLFFALITIVPSMVVGLFLATLVNRKSRLIGFVDVFLQLLCRFLNRCQHLIISQGHQLHCARICLYLRRCCRSRILTT